MRHLDSREGQQQRGILMALKELMTRANYIARTQGSTQPDGSFGPSAWKNNDGSDGIHVDYNSAVASDLLSGC